MYRSFRILPTLCFTSWHRCFPGGIFAGYQDLIFCASGLLLPRPADRLEGLFLPSALMRPWGIPLRLQLFLRLLGSAGQGPLLLHESFGKMVLQFLPNLRADQIPRNDGDRGVGLRRPVPLGKIGGDLAKDMLRFFNQRG